MKRVCGFILIVSIASLLSVGFAAAQSTLPAAAASEYDRKPIRRDAAAPATQSAGVRDVALPGASFDTTRVLLALGAVLSLIFLSRYALKQMFPGAAAARAGSAVRVLSRAPLSPKQQVLLLQVGRRVIVVGDCGTQMSALAEIHDGEEIAALLAEIDSQKSGSVSKFATVFGNARQTFEEPQQDADEEAPPPDLGLAAARGEIQGLMDRVRGIAQKIRQP